MANTVDKQTLVDGSRNLTVKIYLESDGAAGELSAQNLVDASAFNTSDIKIMSIKAHLNGFSAKLLWDATTDEEIISLPEGDQVDMCFKKFGGLINNAGTGVTGDILITTSGFSAAGDYGYIILEMKKKDRV